MLHVQLTLNGNSADSDWARKQPYNMILGADCFNRIFGDLYVGHGKMLNPNKDTVDDKIFLWIKSFNIFIFYTLL